MDDLRRDLDRGSVLLLIFLDLSTVFNTIDHGLLLDSLLKLDGCVWGETPFTLVLLFIFQQISQNGIGRQLLLPYAYGVPLGFSFVSSSFKHLHL